MTLIMADDNNRNQNMEQMVNALAQRQYEVNEVMYEMMNAFTENNRGRVLELIDIYREEFMDQDEEEEQTHSPTECNLLEEVVYFKHILAYEFIVWYIEEIADCPLAESRGIYMFFAFKAAILDANILLANNILNAFGNRFHTDYLYESKFVDDIIDELAENDEEENQPAVIELIINTIYDNQYIERFQVMPYNRNHINYNKEKLINSIQRFR